MSWESFVTWLMEFFRIQKVTKLKLFWTTHQAILSVWAYEWWRARRAEASDYCEFAAANGWTGVGKELAGEIAWWPKDRKQVADLRKYLKGAVDALAPWVEETRKRGLILKIVIWNSNIDQGEKLNPGDLEATADYIVSKYGTKGIMLLAVSETDKDLAQRLRDPFIAHVDRIYPREQTVSMFPRRGDAAFIEQHPPTFKIRPQSSGWSALIVSDNGGTLGEAHSDGVTGHDMRPATVGFFNQWTDWDYSIEYYAFWPFAAFRKWKKELAKIGKHFEAKHGSRK